MNWLGGGSQVADPDSVPAARVVVVGNPGCGKTSLVHALVHGRPPARPAPTVGCSVQVKLIPTDASTSTPTRDAFIELWDVGGGRRTAPLRRLFYADVAGVVVCHDLSASTDAAAHKAAVRAWTQEVASCASFRGAVGGGGASTSGRLPVPLLVVGTKADAAPRGGRSPRRGALASLAAAFARVSPVRPAGGAASAQAARMTSPPPARAGVATATTSAVAGDLDAAAFAEFFKAVLAVRMTGSPPVVGGGGAYGAGWSPSPGGRVGVADVGGGGLGDDDDLV